MLDLKYIREHPETVKTGVGKKNGGGDIDAIVGLDAQRRDILKEVETLKAERNRVSDEIPRKKKAGEPVDEMILAMRKVGDQIAVKDAELRELETKLNTALTWIPNVPHESVPVGDETHNKKIREWGEITKRDFKVLPHWEIGQKLGIMDLEAATNNLRLRILCAQRSRGSA